MDTDSNPQLRSFTSQLTYSWLALALVLDDMWPTDTCIGVSSVAQATHKFMCDLCSMQAAGGASSECALCPRRGGALRRFHGTEGCHTLPGLTNGGMVHINCVNCSSNISYSESRAAGCQFNVGKLCETSYGCAACSLTHIKFFSAPGTMRPCDIDGCPAPRHGLRIQCGGCSRCAHATCAILPTAYY